jgi:hypothetical protein
VTPTGRAARRRGGDRGMATLPYLIAFAFVLLVSGTAMQGALWFSARNAALAAAQEGLRVARAENGTLGAGRAAARDFASEVAAGQLLSPGVQVSTTADQTVVVRVAGVVPSFVPGLTVRVEQVARGPKERWVPPTGDAR